MKIILEICKLFAINEKYDRKQSLINSINHIQIIIKITIELDQGALGLGRGSRDYYLNATMFAKHLNAYRKYQLDIIKLLLDDANITYNLSQLIIDLNDIINFETKFAEVNYQ
ncbi:unnamed protein product [Brugia pahangi]|uniref:Four helix bundle protein n=1 Tax=Brugia pahangi TaxID=6280 RepID=A0A0N4TF50_BRUPA|nr:unnamed protein product [Brugia pahangi]